MSDSRRVKGLNLVDLVKSLRAARKQGGLPDLSDADQALLDQRVLVSSWYPFAEFRRLLHLAHAHVFGGTEQAARAMGEFGARVALQGVHAAFLRAGDPYRTIRALERIWSTNFDFGEVVVEDGEDAIRVSVRGYADMESVHGTLLVGWVRTAAELAGARIQRAQIEQAPWEGGADYVLALHLAG